MGKKDVESIRKLIGKPVQITPWWSQFEKGSYTGVLVDVKRIRMTSYDPEKGRRVRSGPDDFTLVLKPDKETRKWLTGLRILKKGEMPHFMLAGHKVRSQLKL